MTDELTTRETTDLIPSAPLPADRNPALVYLGALAPTGRRTMRHALEAIAGLLTDGRADVGSFPWHQLRYQHVAAVRAALAERHAPATVNTYLAALRGALRAAWQLGLMTAEDYHRAAAVKTVRGETLPAGRSLSSGEIAALMTACVNDPTPAGARDAAVIALLYACGLRRSEVVSLDLADYDPAAGTIRVLGKGHKERLCHIVNGAGRAVADWIALRGDHAGPLFVAVNKGGRLLKGRLSAQAIYELLTKRGAEAGVAPFSPHDLRRSFVSDLLDAGADIVTVQRMAGHADPATTARYDRRGEEAKAKAAAKLHVPYNGRRMI